MQPQYITLAKQAKDITGQRFGRLVALGPIGHAGHHVRWLCRCDCGNTSHALGFNLHSGSTVSCGCFRTEQSRTANGQTAHPLYGTWHFMVRRCNDPRCKPYRDYGGRGIKVCEEWMQSFDAFRDFVEKLPNYGHKGFSLDRINNDGNYEPGNVRWATRAEQSRNTSKTNIITYDGRSQCASDWAKEYGLKSGTLAGRIAKGWDMDRALKTPVKRTK